MPNEQLKITPNDEVLSIVKKSGSSFYWAMRILPKQKRNAMFAIYAFCREVDDIADDVTSPESKLKELKNWREEIESLYAGNPGNTITQALAEPLQIYNFAKEDFMAVIDGMEMDAVERLRIKDLDELILYCDRVACAVGRLSNAVFGLDRPQNEALAKPLGEALQLTNILRDIYEDAERDRVYLPADLLAKYGILGSGINEIIEHPGLTEVCVELAERVTKNFQKAQALIDQTDKKRIQPAIIMMKIYHQLFQKLESRGWDRLDIPIKLSKVWKLWLAARILVFKS